MATGVSLPLTRTTSTFMKACSGSASTVGCVARMPTPYCLGTVFYYADARHRRVALDNLRRVFSPHQSPREIRRLARENFRRIGENFACAAKTAVLSTAVLRSRL